MSYLCSAHGPYPALICNPESASGWSVGRCPKCAEVPANAPVAEPEGEVEQVTGWRRRAEAAEKERDQLRDAIREHRATADADFDSSGDRRLWAAVPGLEEETR